MLLSYFAPIIVIFSLQPSHLSPSFCGVAVSSSPPSFSPVQRYPFFFRMLQMRIPSRPITQKTGTRANTAYSAVFSSALRTTVLLAGPPAPPDWPLPTLRTTLTCNPSERKEEKKSEKDQRRRQRDSRNQFTKSKLRHGNLQKHAYFSRRDFGWELAQRQRSETCEWMKKNQKEPN